MIVEKKEMIMRRKVHRKFSKFTSSKDLYIISAIRTPIGLINSALSEFTAPQLVSFVIREVLQRGVVPLKDLQNVFLSCISHNDCSNEIIKRAGLSNTTRISMVPPCGMKSLSEAIKFLHNDQKVTIAGGMESLTNASSFDQFFPKLSISVNEVTEKVIQDYNDYKKANVHGAFVDEIVKIYFRKKGQQIVIDEDELIKKERLAKGSFSKYFPTPGDGAAAAIISNEDYLTSNGLTPLGKIVSFAEEINSSDLSLAIEKALKVAYCQCADIYRWEIIPPFYNSIFSSEIFRSINPSQINSDGGVLSLGYPIGILGIKAICHLIHSLPAGKLGCVASSDFNKIASAVIIKKLDRRHLGKPQLTLFTKFPCPLCDELKEQLEPFKGRFLLREVDIEAKENEKYKELYQYDIPVLFFNGHFLCKHRLDIEQFRHKILVSESFVD